MTALHQAGMATGDDRSTTYEQMLDDVVGQLAHQLPTGPSLLVLIPTVGFGGQSPAVLERTIEQLGRQRSTVPITVVFLVNRPEARAADDTADRARAAIAAHACPAVRFAVAEVVVTTRVRVGELRQLMLDAVLQVGSLDPASTAMVIADDDLVDVPAGLLHDLYRSVAGPDRADVALGPVLFDSPRTPAPMIPAFFASDALRALLAARFVRAQAATPDDPSRAESFRHFAESIALSGNLVVRAGALSRAGGFAPYNEITGVVRGVHGLPDTRILGTWDFHPEADDVLVELYGCAMRISARRALAAYLATGVPSVGQWRACRFRASRVDPVRLGEPAVEEALPHRLPVAELRPHQVRTLTEQLTGALTTTLRYFPPEPAVVEDCLSALGLPSGTVSLSFGSDPADTSLAIRDPSGLVDRLHAVQQLVTADRAARLG